MSRKRPHKPHKNGQKLQAQTAPGGPGQGSFSGIQIICLPQRVAGIRVDEYNALTFGAVWGCVKVITEALACLPFHAYKKRPGGGRDIADAHTVDWLLHMQANPETTAYTFRETLLAHALTWGNGYAEIERDAAGRPVWIWQITPDRVQVARTSRGNLVYDVSNPRQSNTVLYPEDVFHLKGLGFDGLVGYSVIAMAAKTIGLGLGLEEYGTDFFENDCTPGGTLEHPGKLSDEARKNLRASWQQRHGGPRKKKASWQSWKRD